MAKVLTVSHPRNGDIFSVKVTEDYATVYYNTGTDAAPHYDEQASVNLQTRNVSWYSSGSQSKIGNARTMRMALDVAEAVYTCINAGAEFTDANLATMLDFVLE